MQTEFSELKTKAKLSPAQILGRIGASTLVWLFVYLIVLDISLVTFRPLKYVTVNKFIPLDQSPVISKVPEFLSGHTKPNVVVLGSSLPMHAIGYSDALIYGGDADFKKNLRTYTKSRYLTKCLSEKFHKPFNIGNITCSGCMISDAYLILERSLAEHKNPELVILGIAPRDFIDNLMPPCGQTPAFQLLTNWVGMDDFLKGDTSLAEKTNYVMDRLWYFYRTKVDYRFLATVWTGDFLGRPVSFYDAVQKMKNKDKEKLSDETKGAKKKADLFAESMVMYKNHYNPVNNARYKKELRYFEKLLGLCRDNKMNCVIINMPLTSDNKALLDSKLFKTYLKDTVALAQKYNAQYIDFDADKSFIRSDFEDCVHVNEIGAKKAIDKLISQIDPQLVL